MQVDEGGQIQGTIPVERFEELIAGKITYTEMNWVNKYDDLPLNVADYSII